ncbi:hypothetical protein MSG28_000692 [Choristoneura fumiferana]|uniref:Uncharacterized protein n=1 Tax=Choristoneura fumiferana TaxID=7141 RepID=A0ACC0K215_CHOFU|nr:hypothetical protein MSG28_000692 [Choristoneura fumiferana]
MAWAEVVGTCGTSLKSVPQHEPARVDGGVVEWSRLPDGLLSFLLPRAEAPTLTCYYVVSQAPRDLSRNLIGKTESSVYRLGLRYSYDPHRRSTQHNFIRTSNVKQND